METVNNQTFADNNQVFYRTSSGADWWHISVLTTQKFESNTDVIVYCLQNLKSKYIQVSINGLVTTIKSK